LYAIDVLHRDYGEYLLKNTDGDICHCRLNFTDDDTWDDGKMNRHMAPVRIQRLEITVSLHRQGVIGWKKKKEEC
jgi:hypothetical protein